MPLTPPGLTGPILVSLVATGHLGIATPQLASAVAAGITLWAPSVTAISVDTGLLGVGAGLVPLLVPPPLLLAGLTAGFAAFTLLGPIAPLTIIGLSTGISLGLLQGQVITAHPLVGVGAGVCAFKAPPAGPLMIAGFTSVGITGTSGTKLALAIGMALDIVFTTLVLPTPIVGAGAPFPSAGAGVGKIV